MKLRLRAKIIFNVTLTFFLGLCPAWYGTYNLRQINQQSIAQEQLQQDYRGYTSSVLAHTVWLNTIERALLNETPVEGLNDPNTCSVLIMLSDADAQTSFTNDMNTAAARIKSLHSIAHIEAGDVMNYIALGDMESAYRLYESSIFPSVEQTIEDITYIANEHEKMATSLATAVTEESGAARVMIYSLMFVFFGIGVLVSYNLIHGIMVPIRNLKKLGDMIAEGNLQGNMDYPVDDEIGALVDSFDEINRSIKGLIGELSTMSTKHGDGSEFYYIKTENYSGSFRDVTENINQMVHEYVELNYQILDAMKKYARGEFDVNMPELPGNKIRINQVVETVTENLKNVKEGTLMLVNAAAEGKLDTRISTKGYEGGWGDIIGGLNNLLENIARPLDETVAVLSEMNKGNFTFRVVNDYSGQFGVVKNSLNNTSITMDSYIKDINEILDQVAKGDLTVSISREFVGQFASIKTSINTIVGKLNRIISEITAASEELLSGAGKISSSSLSLAEGASTQAKTIRNFGDSTEIINEQLHVTVDDTLKAKELSQGSMKNALQGNEEMSNMLEAMNEIQVASDNISNIIRVIEDIASQTNLLAINAAVEAARAGVHGKGFNVVADEVRNLAAKSRSAAQDTTKLIQESMESVGHGTTLANSTSSALETIIEDISSISQIVSQISESTKVQADSIDEMNSGLDRVSDVINANSATSEESATAAEELNSQAIMLKEMVEFFKV